MSNDRLADALKQLAMTIKKTIDNGIANGTLKPEEEVYFQWKLDKFRYSDKGITDFSAHGDYITKPSWLRATIKVEDTIKQHSEHSFALEQLINVFGKSGKLSQALDHFVRELIHQHFSASKFEEEDINTLTTTFLKDLREEPLNYGAEVEIQGIVLQPEKIEPDFGITLRQTKREDLEKEVPTYGFTGTPYLQIPSGILEIEFLGRRANEISRRVEHAITVLRLFRVGSVKWLTYHMHTESITDLMASGTLTSGTRTAALETYLVTQEDIPKLKKFWQTISNSIPESFFGIGVTGNDHLTIAYKRYNDALLENGLSERRIANAVMGLEALFLKPVEIQELPYRLSMRIGKLFSVLEYDPHEVKKIIVDAYKVRNLFAHGGHLSYERKKKLESKYKDVKNLLLSVLDYLRISIIVMILCRKEKNEFIDMLDNSLVDRKHEEQLKEVVSQARESFGESK